MHPLGDRFAPLWRSLPVLLLLACGRSADDREAAEVQRATAARVVQLRAMVDHHLGMAAQGCSESPEDLARLLLQHQEYAASIGGKPAPRFDFLAGVKAATAHHDSTKSCAALVDSVARALHK